jgi:hypothetical protein
MTADPVPVRGRGTAVNPIDLDLTTAEQVISSRRCLVADMAV